MIFMMDTNKQIFAKAFGNLVEAISKCRKEIKNSEKMIKELSDLRKKYQKKFDKGDKSVYRTYSSKAAPLFGKIRAELDKQIANFDNIKTHKTELDTVFDNDRTSIFPESIKNKK